MKPLPTAASTSEVATEEPIAPAAIVPSPSTLPTVSATQDNSAAYYKAVFKHVYNYFSTYLPRHVPLCRVAFFSSELLRWAYLVAFELDAGCALSLVSEEKVVIAIAFYNVALDFLKKNPALTLANPNIGLALDALARAIARCIRVLAQQHRQNVVIIELIDAPILFIEEAAAPLLLPAPEVTHDADLTSTTAAPASASEATGSSPATTVPAVTPPPAPVNESEDFKIPAITAASVDATPRVAAATASAGKTKSSAPR
jgi:hypothetical protein